MTFLDCFAGGGLGRIGMEQAGHKCAGYIEIDKYARKAYEAYFDTTGEYTSHDIRTADPEDMPGFDCLLFGWPCQDNSIAGKRAGQGEGTRSGLLYEATGILRAKRPRYFIAENVKGLYTNTRGVDFYKTIQEFADSGYDVQFQLLNTIWFLPQNRERFYFVGHLGGTPRPEVFPIGDSDEKHDETAKERRKGQAVNYLSVRQGANDFHGARTLVIHKNSIAERDSVHCLTGGGHSAGYHSDTDWLVVTQDRHELREHQGKGVPCLKARMATGGNNVPMIIQRSQSGTRRSPVCGTLRCGTLRCEASRSSNFTVEDGDRLRRLTPLECFRLQGAPDDYYYKATEAGISDTQLYKIAGNGMSVPVVYEIARRLLERIEAQE